MCLQQLVELEQNLSQFEARHAHLVALAVQDQAGAQQSVELAEATYPILADPDHAIADRYGVFNLLNDGVAAPSVFIITSPGQIVWSYVGANISDRPAVPVILENLPD